MTGLDSPVVSKHKQTTMKAVDTKASRCRLSTKQVSKELDPTAQGWTRQRKKKKCFRLWHFCQARDKISTLSEGEVYMAFLEQNKGQPNKTVAKIKTYCSYVTATHGQKEQEYLVTMKTGISHQFDSEEFLTVVLYNMVFPLHRQMGEDNLKQRIGI